MISVPCFGSSWESDLGFDLRIQLVRAGSGFFFFAGISEFFPEVRNVEGPGTSH